MDKIQFIKDHLNLTDAEIGKQLNLTKDTIYSIRRKHGIKRENLFGRQLQEKGFNSDSWKYGYVKDKDAGTTIFVRNDDSVSYEAIRDELIDSAKKHSPDYSPIAKHVSKEGHCYIIDPADLHIGKLATQEESGDTYNVKIAIDRANEGISRLLGFVDTENAPQFVFVVGNDILHTELNTRATTKGTPQSVDGEWFKAYRAARELYVNTIEKLMLVGRVHVIHNMSNHDYNTGWLLADSLSCWFNKAVNVSFDIGRTYRKYYRYGNSMMVFTHGDETTAKDLGRLMNTEQPEMYGRCRHKFAYLHHFHSYKKQGQFFTDRLAGIDKLDLTIEWLRSLSGTDTWHNNKGYKSKKAISMFTHSLEDGQIGTNNIWF